jgi:hypothetical protein
MSAVGACGATQSARRRAEQPRHECSHIEPVVSGNRRHQLDRLAQHDAVRKVVVALQVVWLNLALDLAPPAAGSMRSVYSEQRATCTCSCNMHCHDRAARSNPAARDSRGLLLVV